MKPEHISDALNLLPDAVLEEADRARSKKKHPKTNWWKWTAAACVALAVFFAGIRLIPQGTPTIGGDLPLLTIEDFESSMGFEGYQAYDISELVSGNPWNEQADLSTLPVYQNPITYNEMYMPTGGDFDKMEEFLLQIANRLGMDTANLVVTTDAPSEEEQKRTIEKFASVGASVPEGYFDPTACIAEADGIRIVVEQDMTATISFTPERSLPEEYNFTHHASYEDIAAAADYLKETYKTFIGMENPQTNIYGGDYNIYGQQSYSIEFYEEGNSITDRLINYSFYRVAFYCDDEGKLHLARIYQPDLSQKIGEYPIITAEKAAELLQNGNYVTTVPYAMPGLEYAAKVELGYRASPYDGYFIPYYRFYVELPGLEEEDGLKTYGAYYVPAVEEAYITNMPLWDGSFN